MGVTDRTPCRICGCTEEHGCCIGEDGGGIICHWVEPDRCSACAPVAAIIEALKVIQGGTPIAATLRHGANEYLDMLDKPRI